MSESLAWPGMKKKKKKKNNNSDSSTKNKKIKAQIHSLVLALSAMALMALHEQCRCSSSWLKNSSVISSTAGSLHKNVEFLFILSTKRTKLVV